MKVKMQNKPCVICGNPNSDRAHFKTRGAGAGWKNNEYTYLCRKHHMEQGHLNFYRFVQKYPKFSRVLSDNGWKLIQEFGVWKLRKML